MSPGELALQRRVRDGGRTRRGGGRAAAGVRRVSSGPVPALGRPAAAGVLEQAQT